MTKLTEQYIDFGINALNDVSLGAGTPANNSTLVFNDETSKFITRPLGQLVALSRIIREDLTIQEDEFLILKCPKIEPSKRLIVQGQLKVV